MWIDVKIPFDEKGRLAMAYNRALEQGDSEWVLFLDHDVFLCNPFWYEMCIAVIMACKQLPKVALIGCACGGERHYSTMQQNGNPNSNIEHHIKIAKENYLRHGTSIIQIPEHTPGYFMLLKREIAKEIGFIQNKENKGFNNIDVDFGNRLLEAGHHIYHMPGLYIYHRRGMKHLKKEFNTTK